MNLAKRCLKAVDSRLFHRDKIFILDSDRIYEREDSVIFFVCRVANSTDECFIFRLEGDDLDVWIHTCTTKEALDYFESIRDEFESLPDEGPGRDQGEPPKNKSEQLCTLEKINRSPFGQFGHTLLHEVTITKADMIDEETGKKYHLFIEGDEVRDTLSPVPLVSVSELVDTVIHLLYKTDLLECRFNSERDLFHNFHELDRTQSVIEVYRAFQKCSLKRQALELVSSPFFKAMTLDTEDSAAREALDYLLSLLCK